MLAGVSQRAGDTQSNTHTHIHTHTHTHTTRTRIIYIASVNLCKSWPTGSGVYRNVVYLGASAWCTSAHPSTPLPGEGFLFFSFFFLIFKSAMISVGDHHHSDLAGAEYFTVGVGTSAALHTPPKTTSLPFSHGIIVLPAWIHACMHACVCVCVCVCVCLAYIHTHAHTYTYMVTHGIAVT